jgi:hypothetical protein
MTSVLRSMRAALAAIALAAATASLAAPAWAAGAVTVSTLDGSATLAPDGATTVSVSGSGFQSVPNGFGGVYVLFGWVDDPQGGTWAPSRGGAVGEDYRYVPDAESADNAGYQKFLAFPGSQTESSAHGVIAADGSWSVDMIIPGARFESQDRDGGVVSVDCATTTCGIITIGAHGVKNANNESFTPVRFTAAGSATEAAAADVPAEDAAAPAAGTVRLGVERSVVTAGTSIVFTGQGFTPGEQVVAALDGGLTAVGPLTAGALGEVAAALPVPRDIREGTHLVTLTGAGSGAVAEAEVTVSGGGKDSAPASASTPMWAIVVMLSCVALAVVLIAASIVAAIIRARRRRAARRRAAAPPAPGTESGDADQVAARPGLESPVAGTTAADARTAELPAASLGAR